jgi:glycerol-3-phosphate dehydrogenase
MQVHSKFSLHNRSTILEVMAGPILDVLIIGGGITGAGIALDMASRGLRVALIEKNDFASGTSSRSTKLIHGGLRYLKQLEVGLVREVGRERSIVHSNAPHLVRPEPMLLPMLRKGSLSKWTTGLALFVYEWLAGVKATERRTLLSKKATLEQEPLLNKGKTKGGALYTEYRTDDARLVIEILKTANAYGALCANYVDATDFIYEEGKIKGATVIDALTEKTFQIKARHIINATGPWVDALREKDHSLKGKRLHHTKGVHLVVSKHRLPIKQAVYFDSPDGRMIFAIPRADTTYIGTTDTNYKDTLDTPLVSQEDVDYLLNAVNLVFPTVLLQKADVSSSWAGLRPLIHQDGKSPSDLSRKDEIFVAPSGLISIAGGKLTGYRIMAKRITDVVMKQICKSDKKPFKECYTHLILLSGSKFSMQHSLSDFIGQMAGNASLFAADNKEITNLVNRYGSHANEIIKKAYENFTKNGNALLALLSAELEYTLQHEMVFSLNDFLIRRTGRLYFERESLGELAPYVLKEMGLKLKWTKSQTEKNWQDFQLEYKNALAFN